MEGGGGGQTSVYLYTLPPTYEQRQDQSMGRGAREEDRMDRAPVRGTEGEPHTVRKKSPEKTNPMSRRHLK